MDWRIFFQKCLQALLPWPGLYKCASAHFKSWQQPQRALESGCSHGCDELTTPETRSPAAPRNIQERSLTLAGLFSSPTWADVYSRTAPHLPNRSAPLCHAQTDCVWHKSDSVRRTHLPTPASPWLWSVLCLCIPLPRKGNSSAAVGSRWEGWKWALAPSFLHFLTPAWSSAQPGEPFGCWTLGSWVLVQHSLISTKHCLLFWQAACCHPFSCLMLLPLSTLHKHSYPPLLYKWGNRGTHFTSVSFSQVSQFWEAEFESVQMQLQPNFQ